MDYQVAKDDIGVHEIPLKAGEETTVAFEFSIRSIEVENVAGTSRVYFTTDGTEAKVKGPRCRALPAAPHAVETERPLDSTLLPTMVRLISAGDTVVSVTRS